MKTKINKCKPKIVKKVNFKSRNYLEVCLLLILIIFNNFTVKSQNFSDNATNYSGSWDNNSNNGSGFGPWSFNVGANSGGFIGNPSNNGMGTDGIGTTAFGMFSTGTGYFSAYRTINNGIQIGDRFSFYWAINWDANSGSKGFDLRSGGTTIFNVNNGGNSTIITTNGDANSNYGTAPMLITLTRISSTQYTFSMTSRSGGAPYETTINSSVTIDGFNFYIGNQAEGNANRNMYVNGFSITKPITIANGNWNSTSTWLNNTIPPAGASITIDHNVTVNTDISLRSFIINSGKTLTASDATPRTITITDGGFITNNGNFIAGNGTVTFAGAASINGIISFNNTSLSGAVNFGTNSTVNGILSLNTGGSVSINPPLYANGSTLRYNSGGTYGRSTEWSSSSGRGYPHHVQLSGNTTLNVHNNENIQRQIAGSLTIDSGCTFSTSSLNVANESIGVIILGNIINNGTFNLGTSADRVQCANFSNNSGATTTLSTTIGGDLELTGNLIDNATFNANTRAIFFTGNGIQDISGSGTFNIDYIVLNKNSGRVRLLNNLLCEGPNGGNAITLTNSSDILDLNGFTATLGKVGTTSGLSGNGFFRGGSSSSLIINGVGNFQTLRFDPENPGLTNTLFNFTINRTDPNQTAIISLGNNLTINNTLTLTSGRLNIGTNSLSLKGSISRQNGTISASNGIMNFIGELQQTIPSGTFQNNEIASLNISNLSNVITSSAIVVNSSIILNGLLNMQSNNLAGNFNSTIGNGKLVTQSTSNTPIPSGKTWSFTVELNRNGNQTIPAGNYYTIILSNGGNKTLTNNINVSGDLIVNSNVNTIVGDINFNGNEEQNIHGLAFKNISFSGAGAKTFTSDASISSEFGLSFSPDSTGVVDFDGPNDDVKFELFSDDNGTAQINNTNGWTLNGKVTVQRFIPPSRSWRLLTSPLRGTSNSSIYDNWQGIDGEGVLLWHPSGNVSNGLSVGPQPNIWTHNGISWNAVTNTLVADSFYNGEKNNSFLVFPVGPHGGDNIDNNSSANPTTLKPSGQLITGEFTLQNLTLDRYHLIGNPYASPLNIVALSNDNPNFTFWLLDPRLGGNLGGYYTFNGSEWTPLPPNDSASDPSNTNIQSGQAFFVRSGLSNSFTFNENQKISGNSNTWFGRESMQNTNDNKIRVLLDKQINNQWQLVDGVLSVSGANYENDVNEQDALKVSNFNENILFRNGTSNLAIEYLNLPTDTTIQPIRLTGTSATNYRLRVRTEGYSLSNLQPLLQDSLTGILTPIPTDGTSVEIPFSGVISNASNPDTRFSIVYNSLLNLDNPNNTLFKVYPNPTINSELHIDLTNHPNSATYTINTLFGQKVQEGYLKEIQNIISLKQLEGGVYLLRIIENEKIVTKKLIIK